MQRFGLVLTVFLVLLVTGAFPAHAQQSVVVDTLSGSATGNVRSSAEEFYLSLFDPNRVVTGARALGMGGAGLALRGAASSYSINPASVLGIRQLTIESEAVNRSGSGSASSFPGEFLAAPGQSLNTSDLRISPKGRLDFNHLSISFPLMLLGERSVASLAYRRLSTTGFGTESRTELAGDLTQGIPTTFGSGQLTEDGLDAITLTVARETGPLDLGINFNWEGGELRRSQELGITAVGAARFASTTSFKQDVSSFSVDLGGRLDVGSISLAGTMFLPHDLKFTKGRVESRPFPNFLDPSRRLILKNSPTDHNQSVPTMFALGSAIQLGDRLVLAADYWIRPWSESEITRDRIDVFMGFADIADSSTFVWTPVVDPARKETFSAQLDDGNSLRLGLEYMIHDSDRTRVPLRIGFRTETLALSNVKVPDGFVDFNDDGFTEFYGDLVTEWWRRGANPADSLGTLISSILESNNMAFRGDGVDATTFSFGVGVGIDNFTADLAYSRTSYDQKLFFLQAFDPFVFGGGTIVNTTDQSRAESAVSLTLRMVY